MEVSHIDEVSRMEIILTRKEEGKHMRHGFQAVLTIQFSVNHTYDPAAMIQQLHLANA